MHAWTCILAQTHTCTYIYMHKDRKIVSYMADNCYLVLLQDGGQVMAIYVIPRSKGECLSSHYYTEGTSAETDCAKHA